MVLSGRERGLHLGYVGTKITKVHTQMEINHFQGYIKLFSSSFKLKISKHKLIQFFF